MNFKNLIGQTFSEIEFYELLLFELDLLLVRFDRTGTHSSVKKDKTRSENWRTGWADEKPHKTMTRDEIREAFKQRQTIFS